MRRDCRTAQGLFGDVRDFATGSAAIVAEFITETDVIEAAGDLGGLYFGRLAHDMTSIPDGWSEDT